MSHSTQIEVAIRMRPFLPSDPNEEKGIPHIEMDEKNCIVRSNYIEFKMKKIQLKRNISFQNYFVQIPLKKKYSLNVIFLCSFQK